MLLPEYEASLAALCESQDDATVIDYSNLLHHNDALMSFITQVESLIMHNNTERVSEASEYATVAPTMAPHDVVASNEITAPQVASLLDHNAQLNHLAEDVLRDAALGGVQVPMLPPEYEASVAACGEVKHDEDYSAMLHHNDALMSYIRHTESIFMYTQEGGVPKKEVSDLAKEKIHRDLAREKYRVKPALQAKHEQKAAEMLVIPDAAEPPTSMHKELIQYGEMHRHALATKRKYKRVGVGAHEGHMRGCVLRWD